MFNSDQPIQKANQDLLRRGPFASSLGESLMNYRGTESVVIGLFGAWGSGKTSILNMAMEHIQAMSEKLSASEKPILIRFNPWNFSDQNQLISQFFKQISSALKRRDYAGTVKEIGERLESYATLFEPVALVTPIGPPALFLSKWVKGWGSAAKKIASLKSANLDSVKTELNNLLGKQSRKIIVVIDDIDRLNNTEIRQVFQLVKSL